MIKLLFMDNENFKHQETVTPIPVLRTFIGEKQMKFTKIDIRPIYLYQVEIQ